MNLNNDLDTPDTSAFKELQLAAYNTASFCIEINSRPPKTFEVQLNRQKTADRLKDNQNKVIKQRTQELINQDHLTEDAAAKLAHSEWIHFTISYMGNNLDN